MGARRRHACTGKQRHETKAAAQAHLSSLIHNGAAAFARTVYKCRFCGGYHVGHRPNHRGRRQ